MHDAPIAVQTLCDAFDISAPGTLPDQTIVMKKRSFQELYRYTNFHDYSFPFLSHFRV